jgi:hypothetical protein
MMEVVAEMKADFWGNNHDKKRAYEDSTGDDIRKRTKSKHFSNGGASSGASVGPPETPSKTGSVGKANVSPWGQRLLGTPSKPPHDVYPSQ